jgi:multidrug efflux pump subunit AcrA (membrane-fusion protein)
MVVNNDPGLKAYLASTASPDAKAQRYLDRLASLAARDIATKQSLDDQQALVAQLGAAIQGDQALVDSAKVQLGYTTIRSPIDGELLSLAMPTPPAKPSAT